MTRLRRFTETAVLAATPERAFWSSIATDAPAKADPEGFEYWEPDELPPRKGTVNTMKLTAILGVRLKVRSRFVEFEPPRRMVVEGVSPFFSPWTRLTYDIEPLDGQRVRYTITTEISSPSWAGPIAAVMTRVLRKRIVAAISWTARRFPASESESRVEDVRDPRSGDDRKG